jgi:hypothetical protein
VQLNTPGSDLERRAHLLLAQLEDLELGEAESEGAELGWEKRAYEEGRVLGSRGKRLQT